MKPLHILARLRAFATPIQFTPPCVNDDLSVLVGIKVGKTRLRQVFVYPYPTRREQINEVIENIHANTGRLYCYHVIEAKWSAGCP